MTDVTQLPALATAISSNSPRVKAYAKAQATVSQLQEADIQASLATELTGVPVGAMLELSNVPVSLYSGAIIAVDAYTTECELRLVTAVTGTTVTLDAPLIFAHDAGDAVVVITGSDTPVSLYGITGNGADEWSPLQRLFREASKYALVIDGQRRRIDVGQPLLLSEHEAKRVWVRSEPTFAPVEPEGAMVMLGNVLLPLSADPATNTLTVSPKHSLSSYHTDGNVKMAFCAPYGETLPTPLQAGRVYYTDTIVSPTQFTVSATPGGPTLDITSDGSGWWCGSINELGRLCWQTMRFDLTVPDLNGVLTSLQQPAFTKDTRIEMDAPAVTKAIGWWVSGQISYHDNVEVNPHKNCIGMLVTGSGVKVRGFNCNGINDGDVGMVIGGTCSAVCDPWTESTAVGIRIVPTARGIDIGGTWLGAPPALTTPMLQVGGLNTSYKVGLMRCPSSGQLMIDDTVRGYQIRSGVDTDSGSVFGGLRQPYGNVPALLADRP